MCSGCCSVRSGPRDRGSRGVLSVRFGSAEYRREDGAGGQGRGWRWCQGRGWRQGGRVPVRAGSGAPKLLRWPRRVDPLRDSAKDRERAIGNGSTNDAWLSQTVGAPDPARTGTLRACVERGGARYSMPSHDCGRLLVGCEWIPVFTGMTRFGAKAQRHSREGGNPCFSSGCGWIPVFTGMTRFGAKAQRHSREGGNPCFFIRLRMDPRLHGDDSIWRESSASFPRRRESMLFHQVANGSPSSRG